MHETLNYLNRFYSIVNNKLLRQYKVKNCYIAITVVQVRDDEA